MGGLFTIVSISMPRSGGDYVFTTRGLNSFLGFVNYWGLAIAWILNLGIFTFYGSQYFGYLFGSLGAFYNNSGYAALGSYITQPGPSIALSIALIAISTVIAMAKPRVAWGFVLWAGIVTVVCTAIMFVGLAGIQPATFQTAYNSFMGNATAYNAVISAGGITPPSSWWLATTAALPFTWFAYTWYNLPVSWSGEVKRVSKSMPIAILGGLIVVLVYYEIFTYFTLHAFGRAFLENWSSLAASGNPPIAGIGGFIPFFALLVYRNIPLFYAMFIALWLANTYSFPPLIISQTRYIFAWAFDRVLPDKFATVNERLHTPLYATLAVAVGGVIGASLMALLPNSGEFATLAFTIFTFGFIIPAIVAIVYPYRRKDLYETAFIAKKKFGIPLLSWLGLGSALYLIYSTYLAYQSGSLPVDPFMMTLYGCIYGLGIVIYLAAYWTNTRRGLPFSMVFKEIPPE